MDASRMERDELDGNSNQFARLFKLQRGELLRKQDQKRAGFDKRWQRQTEQTAREAARELAELSTGKGTSPRPKRASQSSSPASVTTKELHTSRFRAAWLF
jgi:hypothetical protein